MPFSDSNVDTFRGFALTVVRRLRDAGFEALWAGGCVRDNLLGIEPKDYDVATTATPSQVIELFGKRKTVPVGVKFGVVIVLGPVRSSGQVEVATFRSDGQYHDGRRPSEVIFSSAREDAKRRDFTINGMFYDPINDNVIDYVGGRTDLQARTVRAIGDAHARLSEDKLRMLRAVRFAATYEFQLEDTTAAAIRELHDEIHQVSVERIAQELKRMLSHDTRQISVRKLFDVRLLEVLFPNVCPPEICDQENVSKICDVLACLKEPTFEPSLAILWRTKLKERDARQRERTVEIRSECRRLKLSNEESGAICWIVDSAHVCQLPEAVPLHVIKPILSDPRRNLLFDYLRASAVGLRKPPLAADFLESYVATTASTVLNPEPLIDGGDLIRLGVESGPSFNRLLTDIRNEQLNEKLQSREQALLRLKQLSRQACDE